ncbi:MAG: family 16 glycosylhydrolase [Bacteroidia bacterium]|nr:family 16 glycosylhydrolase [Bacteroidia bacterium]
MLRILSLVFVLVVSFSTSVFSQVASCVRGQGISYLLDAYLGSIGACNCGKATTLLLEFPECKEEVYVLDFIDEFNGNSLDTALWQIQPWGQGSLENSANLEYNSLDNVTVKDGKCFITAKKETVIRRAIHWKQDDEILEDGKPNLRTYYYTSSNIWTKGQFFRGKYEIRCKMPAGNGFWPAFWMFGGKRWNEIDVFDSYAGTSKYVSSIGHDYDKTGKSNGCSKILTGFDFTKWHTFTCIFDYDKISFLIDGETIRVIHHFLTVSGNPLSCGDKIDYGTYFELKSYPIEKMHIIVNLALIRKGEDNFIEVDETTPFPSSFEIDYIKMWRRSDEKEEIEVWPNPTNGNIVVNSNTDIYSLVIFNAEGKPVYVSKEILSLPRNIDLSDRPDGLYLILAELPGGFKTSKIIKQSD